MEVDIMNAEALLLGFINAVMTCAIIIFIAFVIVWVYGMVYKWGQIIVGLLCLIVIVSWLLSLPHTFSGDGRPTNIDPMKDQEPFDPKVCKGC